MGDLLDDKQIETLNALTKGRPLRGKWRVIAVLALIGLLLLAGAAAHIAVIGECQRRHAQVGRAFGQAGHGRPAIKEAVIRVHVQMYELGHMQWYHTGATGPVPPFGKHVG